MHQPTLVASLVHLLITGLSVYVVAAIFPGIRARSFGSAVWFAFVVGLLNAVLWTLFWPLALPFKVLTLGLGGLLLNGLVFSLAGRISRGVQVSGCITGALASIGVTILNGVLVRILLGHY
jgi:putative membrane protein